MKKPAENTVQSFCELVSEEISARGFKTLREAAQAIRVAPDLLYRIGKGDLGKPVSERPGAVKKWVDGKVGSITRICAALELDLESCLIACGLPVVPNVIRKSAHVFRIGKEELELLSKAIDIFGPLTLDGVSKILLVHRERKENDGVT
jgi:hypothetical protein